MWYVEINLDANGEPSNVYSSVDDTVFRFAVYADEWGFIASRPKKGSHIRVREEPFDHGGDDLGLLDDDVPELVNIGPYFRAIEKQLGAVFPRDKCFIRTNLAGAKPAVQAWVASL